jgi:hypothetical protein
MKLIQISGIINSTLGILFLSAYIFIRWDLIQLPAAYAVGLILIGLFIFTVGTVQIFVKR